jgi:hypothetical protein
MANALIKLEPIDRDIKLAISDLLSPEAQSKYLAEFARESSAAVGAANAKVLGRYDFDVIKYVDGVANIAEEFVKPHGTIVYDFQIGSDVVQFIGQQLQMHSPVGTLPDNHPGRYKKSHALFADGVEIEGNQIPRDVHEFLFVSTLPYSRKIEHGESGQAPDGVYEVTANQAKRKFGRVSKIEFIDYVGIFGVMAQSPPTASYGKHTAKHQNRSSNRYPAIRVTQ